MAKGFRLEDLDPEPETNLEKEKETAENVEQDLEEQLRILQKDLKGKDRAINRLKQENDELKAQKPGGDAPSPGPSDPPLERLTKLEARLEAEERVLREQQQAFNEALKENIPVKMAIGNAGRWDEFKREIAELSDGIRDGVLAKGKQGSWAARQTPGLDYTKLSRSELAEVPAHILERIQHGGKV